MNNVCKAADFDLGREMFSYWAGLLSHCTLEGGPNHSEKITKFHLLLLWRRLKPLTQYGTLFDVLWFFDHLCDRRKSVDSVLEKRGFSLMCT